MTHSTHGRYGRRTGWVCARQWHRVLGAALGPALWTVTACRDVPAPPDPIARPIGSPAQSRAPIYEPNFDRYTARVVVTMTGGGIAALAPLPERQVEYQVERTLAQEGGFWTTTYDFESVREAGTLRRIPIRKVVAGADGMKYYDHNGSLIPLGTRLPEVENAADYPAFPEAGPGVGRGTAGDPRGWAMNLVTSPEQGAKRRAEIARSFVRADARGRAVRYRRERDDLVTEIVFDTTRGTIMETRTSRGGRLAATTTFEYQDIGGNQWLRVRALHRQEDPGADRHPLVVEQVLADQRFHRREGR